MNPVQISQGDRRAEDYVLEELGDQVDLEDAAVVERERVHLERAGRRIGA